MILSVPLPLPPSVNEIWVPVAKGKMVRSQVYTDWIKRARDEFNVWKAQQRLRYWDALFKGEFCSLLLLDHRHRADNDNRVKPALDFAQNVRLIENDKFNAVGMYSWAKVNGALLILESGRFPKELISALSLALSEIEQR